MRCKYLPQDLNARLHGGLAFYAGEPVLVDVVDANINLLSFSGLKFLRKIEEDDPLFDISSPALGYVNHKKGAIYFYRRPERKYKQTLTSGCLGSWTPYNQAEIGEHNNAFNSKAFADMLKGIYPTLTEAFAILDKGERTSIAVNRDVCLLKDSFGNFRVYYKMEQVGIMRNNDGIVRVGKSCHSWVISKYLSELNWRVE